MCDEPGRRSTSEVDQQLRLVSDIIQGLMVNHGISSEELARRLRTVDLAGNTAGNTAQAGTAWRTVASGLGFDEANLNADGSVDPAKGLLPTPDTTGRPISPFGGGASGGRMVGCGTLGGSADADRVGSYGGSLNVQDEALSFYKDAIGSDFGPYYLATSPVGIVPATLPVSFFDGAAVTLKETKGLASHAAVVESLARELLDCTASRTRIRQVLRQLLGMLKRLYQVAAVHYIADSVGAGATVRAEIAAYADSRVLTALMEAIDTSVRLRSLVDSLTSSDIYSTATANKRVSLLLPHLVVSLGPSSEYEIANKFRTEAATKEGMTVYGFLAATARSAESYGIAEAEAMRHAQLELARANELYAARGVINSPPYAVLAMLKNSEFHELRLSEVVRKLDGGFSGSHADGLVLPPSPPPGDSAAADLSDMIEYQFGGDVASFVAADLCDPNVFADDIAKHNGLGGMPGRSDFSWQQPLSSPPQA